MIQRHPNLILDGRKRVVRLGESVVVVSSQTEPRFALANDPIGPIQRVEAALDLPAVRQTVSICVGLGVQRFFGLGQAT